MKKIKLLILLLITCLLLYFLFTKFDIKEILNIYINSNKFLLIIATLIMLLIPFLCAYRWKLVINTINTDVPYKTLLKAYWASIPVSKITPGSAGDLIRSYYLKDKIPASQGIGIILFERLLDVGVIAFLALTGGIIINFRLAVILGLSILLGIILFLIFVPKIKISNEKWKLKIYNLFLIFNKIFKSKKRFLIILVLTLIQWLLIILFVFITFLAIGENINYLKVLTIQPIVMLVSLAPFTLSGIGAREAIMVLIYNNLVLGSSALAVGIMYSFTGTIVLSLIGLPLMISILKNNNKNILK